MDTPDRIRARRKRRHRNRIARLLVDLPERDVSIASPFFDLGGRCPRDLLEGDILALEGLYERARHSGSQRPIEGEGAWYEWGSPAMN